MNDQDSPISGIINFNRVTETFVEEIETETAIAEGTAEPTAEKTPEAEIEETDPAEEIIERTPEIKTISLWVPPQFDTEQDTQGGRALAAAIASYTELHPNINITLRVKATSGDSNVLSTLTAANNIAPDVLPSLVLLSRGDMETTVQRGLAKPITTSIFSDSNSWNAYARQSAVIDSMIYGIPILGDGLVLTYRISKTGGELTDWHDILTRGLPIGFAPSSSSSLFGTFMYLSMGGKLTNDQGQPYLDPQKLTDTLNFFLVGGQNGAFPPSLAQLLDQSQVWQRFSDGTMAIIVSQFSSFRHYQTPEISVHELPTTEKVTGYPLINTWNLVLIENDPDLQPEAVSFAEYLADIYNNDLLSVRAGYLPVRNSSHEEWQDDPQSEIIQLMSENAVLVPNNQILHKIVPIINNAVTQVVKNQMTPENAVQEAISVLN